MYTQLVVVHSIQPWSAIQYRLGVLFQKRSFNGFLTGKRELVALLCLSSWCLARACCVALPHDATGLSAVGDCGIS